jgi:hypothetical protein
MRFQVPPKASVVELNIAPFERRGASIMRPRVR